MKKPNQQAGFIREPGAGVKGKDSQYGGTILGFILGLGAGLGIAFVIAFYLSKNTPQERPGVRAPSLPLTIKPSGTPAEGEAAAPVEQLDLNKPLQGKAPAAAAADPIGDLVNSKKPAETTPAPAAKSDAIYFLQVGAFVKRSDADAQKANLAMQGIQAQLSESAVDGNSVWRVRIGPFGSIEDTTSVRSKLTILGIKPTVIRVNRS